MHFNGNCEIILQRSHMIGSSVKSFMARICGLQIWILVNGRNSFKHSWIFQTKSVTPNKSLSGDTMSTIIRTTYMKQIYNPDEFGETVDKSIAVADKLKEQFDFD